MSRQSVDMYENCMLCPRRCGVDRRVNTGYCRMLDRLYVARAALHFWEEPCISGDSGSGTVFFSGCSLRCVYCQNSAISTGVSGKEISVSRLADIFIELQEKGANNINLVTPDHYAYHICESLNIASKRGLNIPVVYNTSGYCSVDTLKMLSGMVDIYLTDFKYMDGFAARRYSNASDYPEIAAAALSEMYRQVPKCRFDNGLMKKGIIVRHLVLPNNIKNSKLVLDYLHKSYGDNIYISIMNQYTPCGNLKDFHEIVRRVSRGEYERVLKYAKRSGIKNAFIQEGGANQKSFIPQFDNEGV